MNISFTSKHSIFFFLILIGGISKAQWNSNPIIADTKVVVANQLQWNHLMVSNGEGGAIVFWNDRRATNFDNKVYIDNLSSNGTLLWSVPNSYLGKAVCTASGQQFVNDLIRDVDGNYFVAWEDFRVTTGDIYIQKINATGQLQWNANGVAICTAIRGQGGVRLLSDGFGGVICCWRDLRNAPGSDSRFEAYAQRIDANGNSLWTTNGVKINSNLSLPADIIPDGAGGAIISLYDLRNVPNPDDDASNTDIYAQRISPSGSLLWGLGGTPVCTQSKNQTNDYHNMVSDGNGGAILYWQDYRNDPNNGGYQVGSADIYAQKINNGGVAQWLLNGVVISDAPERSSSLKVVTDGQGGSVASWIQFNSASSTLNSQRTNASGLNLWPTNGAIVSSSTGSYSISLDNIGGAIYTYENSNSQNVSHIRAQRVQLATGMLLWPSNGVPVVTRDQSARVPTLVTSQQGEAIVVWQDERNINTTGIDLYAAKLSSNSVLPIRLINVTGILKSNDASIQWEIATESNAFTFGLERSFNGGTFEPISSIHSSNSGKKSFEILDRNVIKYGTPTLYYRLKMVDDDGKITYSKTIRLTIPKNRNRIKLENNPVSEIARLTYVSDFKGEVLLRIIDVNGKVNYLSKLNVIKGVNQAIINVSRLAEGTYLLQVIGQESNDNIIFLK